MKTSLLDKLGQTYQTLHYYLILSYAFEFMACVGEADTSADHLNFAKKLLSTGNYNDALPHFHEAINADPNNYLTYFKRATVFLALNRPKSALDDLNKALELNNQFPSALEQRALLLVKLGQLDEAHIDFEKFLRQEPDNSQAWAMYERIDKLRDEIENVQRLFDDYQYDIALPSISSLIEIIPFSSELLKMRALAYEKVGETGRAISDYRTLAKLTVDSSTYLKIAKLSYSLGGIEDALNSVRECLKLDPDHKACMDFYKPIKKLNNHIQNMLGSKESKDNDGCHTHGKHALKLLKDNKDHLALIHSIQSVMCYCLSKAENTEGLKVCEEALDNSHEGGIEGIAIDKADIICDKADLLAYNEDYARALKAYQDSNSLKPSKRAREGIERIKRLQKQRKKRDYYKILGVNRGAPESEINRAYRKLAVKWHPDRHQDEESKKMAQQKFMDIADAKAVLTDPEKRQQYDRGEDPLDPESKQQHQRGYYADPFAQAFGAGGSPFTFKFNF